MMPVNLKLALLLILLFVVACSAKKQKTESKTQATTTQKKELTTPKKTEAAVAKSTLAPVSIPKKQILGAAQPDKARPFLSINKITDNDDMKSLILKLADTSHTTKNLRIQFEGMKKFGSIKTLLRAMRAKNTNIRSQASKILNRMKHKSPEYTKLLNSIVLSDPDPDVRGVIARVMVYYHARGTASALAEALVKDSAESVRMHAAWALGAIGDKSVTSALISALDDKKTNVRLRAVGALKRLNARKAVRHLVGRLSDTNVLVRNRAHDALRALTGKKLGKKESAWRKLYPNKK